MKRKKKRSAKKGRRKQRKAQATPAWCDFERVELLRQMAKALSTATGIKYNVDHVIPLQGELVCGLNTPENMEVVPARYNLLKGNTFDVEGEDNGEQSDTL